MLRKTHLVAVLVVFTALLSGCAVVGAGVGKAIGDSAFGELN